MQVVLQGFIFDAQMKFLFLCVMLLFQINGTMLEKSDFFEDRQAVILTFCLWCNSVLNSLKSVRETFFVQSGGLKVSYTSSNL